MNHNWNDVVKTKILKHNDRNYHILKIPVNTLIYRGFCRGKKNGSEREQGIFYGHMDVAYYYADNPDYCRGGGEVHFVQEYLTKRVIKLLDLNVWENLKYIVDDLGYNDVFSYTHGFDPTEKKPLSRFSSEETDREMIEYIQEWFALPTSPKLDGFGGKEMPMMMDGEILEEPFHAEIACVKCDEKIQLRKSYYSLDRHPKEYKNIEDENDSIVRNWEGGRRPKKKSRGKVQKIIKTRKRRKYKV